MSARPSLRRGLAAAAAIAVAVWAHAAPAQTAGLTGPDGEPVVIEAEDGIEWRQAEQVYVARGNATAVQGGTTVAAEVLRAYYREADGETDITRVEATGGVTITSGERTITGGHGVYNVETGVFTLTGGDLRLETPTETVTATDKLEYRSVEQVAEVVGNAKATKEDKTVRAERFVAHFEENADGELALSKVDALGDVVITTATEIAMGERGVYNADTGIATLTGGVRLTRGDNQLNGEYAEVNLNTGVSRILGSGEGDRVRGLFIPRDGPEQDVLGGGEDGDANGNGAGN